MNLYESPDEDLSNMQFEALRQYSGFNQKVKELEEEYEKLHAVGRRLGESLRISEEQKLLDEQLEALKKEREKIEKINSEYKKKITQLSQIKDLNGPEARKIIDSLIELK